MKARKVKLEGVDRKDLIALIESDGTWTVITTKLAVEKFEPAFAYLDDDILRDMSGTAIAFDEDIELIGPLLEVEFQK